LTTDFSTVANIEELVYKLGLFYIWPNFVHFIFTSFGGSEKWLDYSFLFLNVESLNWKIGRKAQLESIEISPTLISWMDARQERLYSDLKMQLSGLYTSKVTFSSFLFGKKAKISFPCKFCTKVPYL